jgi:hypothetical protein
MIYKKYKRNHRFLKNLNTLYPGDIKKNLIKMRGRFIELEKKLMKKGLSFIWILFPG